MLMCNGYSSLVRFLRSGNHNMSLFVIGVVVLRSLQNSVPTLRVCFQDLLSVVDCRLSLKWFTLESVRYSTVTCQN